MSIGPSEPNRDPDQPGGAAGSTRAGDDFSGWDDARLVAEVTSVERQARALGARGARLAVEFSRRHPETSAGPTEDGLSLAALDELSVASGLARGSYGYRLRDAIELGRRFPKLLDAWEAGLLPPAAVRKVLEMTCGVGDRPCARLEVELLTRLGRPTHVGLATMPVAEMLQIDDETAMTLSSRATTARVGRITRDLLSRLAPGARAERHRRAKARRRVDFDPGSDSMGWLGARLPQAVGWASYERIDAVARALPDHPDDDRTLDAKRADVLVDLLLGTSVDNPGYLGLPAPAATDRHPSGDGVAGQDDTGGEERNEGAPVPGREREVGHRGPRPSAAPVQLQVLVDHTRCQSGDGGCFGDAGRLGPVTAEVIGDLISLALTSGGRINGGHVVTQSCPGAEHHAVNGPGPYQPPEPLKRFVRARHRRCVWPGCDRPSRACDLDHSIPHPRGPTCSCNLAPLCSYHHHHVKHHPGRDGRPAWRLTNHGEGHLSWTTPTCRVIHIWPEQPDGPDSPGPGDR